MKTIIKSLAVFAAFIVGSASASADEAIYTGIFNDHAVSGYDTVAYFTDGKPVKGEKKFRTDYMGAEWRFSSQENLDAFLADPAKYAPQYGGYCAWAMASGNKASGDPKHWKIVGGKLYLNYNADVKAEWEKDIPGFIEKADAQYPVAVGLIED